MIVPYIDKAGQKPQVGDKLVLTKNIQKPFFLVKAGSILTFVGEDEKQNPGYILRDDDSGVLVTRVSCIDIKHYCPSYEEAEKIYLQKLDKRKFNDFVRRNCRNFNCTCDVSHCDVKNECIVHISPYVYKDNDFIKNYIRSIKIDKLKNNESNPFK